jgi:hypothetical protein
MGGGKKWVRIVVVAILDLRFCHQIDMCADRSRAEKLWLVCGVTGDVILCDTERDIHPSQKLYATIHSEKNSSNSMFSL